MSPVEFPCWSFLIKSSFSPSSGGYRDFLILLSPTEAWSVKDFSFKNVFISNRRLFGVRCQSSLICGNGFEKSFLPTETIIPQKSSVLISWSKILWSPAEACLWEFFFKNSFIPSGGCTYEILVPKFSLPQQYSCYSFVAVWTWDFSSSRLKLVWNQSQFSPHQTRCEDIPIMMGAQFSFLTRVTSQSGWNHVCYSAPEWYPNHDGYPVCYYSPEWCPN